MPINDRVRLPINDRVRLPLNDWDDTGTSSRGGGLTSFNGLEAYGFHRSNAGAA